MADIKILGPAPSSYLRSTRMACVEEGIEHELVPLELGSDAHRARHPYFEVPTLEHGDVRIYETNAIIHYPATTPCAWSRARGPIASSS